MVSVVNRWTRTRIGKELEQCGQVCNIREVEMAVVAVVSNTDPPREEIMPTKIKEVLKEWGCTWMWKSLRLENFFYLGRHYFFAWWIRI